MFKKIAPEELLNFNERGWIPGPDEDEKTFLHRIKELDHFFSYPPPSVDDFLTDRDWESARGLTSKLFDFSSHWIVAHYSNQNLPFFQGAATWLFEKNGVQMPLIQLKTKFEEGSLYKIYRKEEVLAHECVHAARMAFHGPKFEEIFAYKTSALPLRKYAGPLFQKSWESTIFFVLLIFPFLVQAIFLFLEPFPYWWGVLLFPWAYLALLGIRLAYLHIKLSKCLQKVGKVLLKPAQALPFAFRLTDEEILHFAKSSPEEIKVYAKAQKSLRWRLITTAYNLR